MDTSPSATESSSIVPRLEEAVASWVDPLLGVSLGEAKAVRRVAPEGPGYVVSLRLGFPIRSHGPELEQALGAHLREVLGPEIAGAVRIELESRIAAHAAQKGVEPLKSIRNVIAVASGKGGVGKSTVSANLALALAAEGARVGVLDADIYGPSQPRMLGAGGRPESPDGKTIEPIVSYGVQSMSIGYLIEEETPMIWRGPMVTQALDQLLRETRWQDVDYLIIDLPPGTGDIQLTLAQRIPVAGAVIVTTPQDIALLDARKGLKMFEKVGVPVLGVIENMSVHVCSRCGHEEPIFGEGGGERMARQYGVELLGQLPLHLRIREDADSGQPSVVKEPDGPIARRFRDIALRLAARLSLRPKEYAQAFPGIELGGGTPSR